MKRSMLIIAGMVALTTIAYGDKKSNVTPTPYPSIKLNLSDYTKFVLDQHRNTKRVTSRRIEGNKVVEDWVHKGKTWSVTNEVKHVVGKQLENTYTQHIKKLEKLADEAEAKGAEKVNKKLEKYREKLQKKLDKAKTDEERALYEEMLKELE